MPKTLSLSCALALVLVACGETKPPEAPTGPETKPSAAATETTAPKSEDKDAKKAAALETLTQEESQKGACDPEHQAALEKLRAELDAQVPQKAGEDGKPLALKPIFNRVVALGPNARSVEISLQGSLTQAHVIAYSSKDVSIDVLVGKSAASTMRSPLQLTALPKLAIDLAKVGGSVELASDSRLVELEKGQPIVVKATGQGCALVVGYMKP